MPNETTIADSSPADVFEGKDVTLAEYSHYRSSGELPERFKPEAESAPADTQEETEEPEAEEPEPAPESDPEESQEPKGSGAEKRIKQLLAKVKELERQQAAKQDAKPESSPATETTRPKPTADDKKADGTPKFTTYEDFVEDLADWKAEQRMETAKREQKQQDALKALQTKLADARSRYDDADDVIFPAGKAIHEAQIPPAVKAVFEDSELFLDLCYVVGSDPDELKKFISLAQSNPRQAIAKVFDYERAIQDELKPKDAAPEPKRTNAPKPPSPVGGATGRGFDVSDESSSPEEWMRKRNQELAKKRG